MSYFKKVPSLEERASLEVALNLCQDSSFKAAALCLEGPTYGFIYNERDFPLFVSNPKKLLKLNEQKTDASNSSSKFFGLHKDIDILDYNKVPPFINDSRILSLWKKTGQNINIDDFNDEDSVGRWYFEVEKQCQNLIKNLPNSLKFKVCAWINRIALEYISYCRRQEVCFRVSRYFLMNFLIRKDWTVACRLDEMKLARRLIKDERLTVLQRYYIAYVYCLLDDIPRLFERLTVIEKNFVFETTEITESQVANRSIQIWKVDRDKDQNVTLQQLVVYGNVALLMPFWKKLEEKVRQDNIIDLAMMSVKYWHMVESDPKELCASRKELISKEIYSKQSFSVSCLNLQSYYSELLLFFLLEMNEDQKILFFQKSFENEELNVFECFLDWPIRDYFLETINQLWEILPLNKYRFCLISLANFYSASYHTTLQLEYSENYLLYYGYLKMRVPEGALWYFIYDRYCRSLYRKGNQYYDYHSLLWNLWEETPPAYKQRLFYDQNVDPFSVRNVDRIEFTFFTQLFKKSPFELKDEALFKRIFRDLPEAFRKPMIRSAVGEDICSKLLEKEKYSFVTWLLQQCLEEDEIPYHKKQFINSKTGRRLCLYKLYENSLLDLLDWTFDLDSEKAQFKNELFNRENCIAQCKLMIKRGEFSEVERMMNFCSSSDESKKEFKARCAHHVCDTLLADNKFEQLDKVLLWCFDTEVDIKNFKKDFFTIVGLDTHYRLVFLEKLEEVQWFYKWFDLSPQEIKKLKLKTAFKNVPCVRRGLFHSEDVMTFFVAPLRLCLTDQKSVITFKNRCIDRCFNHSPTVEDERLAKRRLSFLVQELLSGMIIRF